MIKSQIQRWFLNDFPKKTLDLDIYARKEK